MDELKKIIKQTVNEVMAQLQDYHPVTEKSELPLGGDEKYIKQQQSQEAPMPVNVAGPPSCFGEDAGEKVETKLISPQGTAYFHNHGCIVANHSGTPLKAVCTEMDVAGQRSYYVRLDEA